MGGKGGEKKTARNSPAFDTLAVRAGQRRTPEGEHSDPLFLTSSYVFDNAKQAAQRFAGEEEGNVYSRYTNPTVAAFEQRLAALEGGVNGWRIAWSADVGYALARIHI